MRFVYIAGPYASSGDRLTNVHLALAAATRLRAAGAVPFVPHLFHFWHELHPAPEESWLALDLEWLSRCDALLRLPGSSRGADQEVAWMRGLHRPVFFSEEELLSELQVQRAQERGEP